MLWKHHCRRQLKSVAAAQAHNDFETALLGREQEQQGCRKNPLTDFASSQVGTRAETAWLQHNPAADSASETMRKCKLFESGCCGRTRSL